MWKIVTPDVLFLQETKLSGSRTQDSLSNWIKDWSFFYVDASSLAGGLITVVSPSIFVQSSVSSPSYIKNSIHDPQSGCSFTLLNVYGPYSDKTTIWRDFFLQIFGIPIILSSVEI